MKTRKRKKSLKMKKELKNTEKFKKTFVSKIKERNLFD
jgi:hypothetical protein